MCKPRYKSKTLWAALAVSVVGIIELNFPTLQPLLGEWYGVSFIAISAVMAILRELTKEPVGDVKQN